MEKYHKYVFDTEKRKFIGDFETMYKKESVENFDSWHQEDTRQLHRRLILELLNDFNFSNILDIGCGKGYFTHQLKKKNNLVHGIDISPTAVKIAKEKFKDISFETLNINELIKLNKLISNSSYDLILIIEVLSYCKNWKEIIETISKNNSSILISSFIPENPIGEIKSSAELISELNKHFIPTEIITLHQSKFTIYFTKK